MNLDGRQGSAMHPNDNPVSSPCRSQQQAAKECEQQQQRLDPSQPTTESSEPIGATGSSPAASSQPLRKQSSVHSFKVSALPLSLQDNKNKHSTLKSSALSPKLASSANAEALISDTTNSSGTPEDKSVKSAKTDDSTSSSASKALERIIQLSGPKAPASSSTSEDTDPQHASVDDTDQSMEPMASTIPTTTTPTPNPTAATPFIGTVLEGHAFQPSSPPSSSLAPEPTSTPTPAGEPSNAQPLIKRSKNAARLYKGDTASQRSSLSLLADWWSGSNASSTTALPTFETTQDENEPTATTRQDQSETALQAKPQEESTDPLADTSMFIDTTIPAAEMAAAIADGTIGSRVSTEWEPSGPEKAALERIKVSKGDQDSSSSTSLPNSLPSHLTSSFPASMIKSSGKATSVKERRGSTSSSYSQSSSSWWGLWGAAGGGSTNSSGDSPSAEDSLPQQSAMTPHLSSLAKQVITASELDMEQLEGEDYEPSSGENRGSAGEGGLMIAATNGSEQQKQASKRWTIFGLGGGSSSSNSTKNDDSSSATPTDSSVAVTSDHATGTTIIKTSVAVPNTNVEGDAKEKKQEEAAPTAPALVSTAEVDVTVQLSTKDTDKDGTALVAGNNSSSGYAGWLSVIPGFGNNKTVDGTQAQRRVQEEVALSHQVTDYQEGERRDIHGNVIKFKPQLDEDENEPGSTIPTRKADQKAKTLAQAAEEKRETKRIKAIDGSGSSNSNSSNGPSSPAGSDRQTFSQLKEKEDKKDKKAGSIAKEVAGKAAATLSKMVKPKNVVLPAYYDQFPDASECLLTIPVGPGEIPVAENGGRGQHARRSSLMSSAVNVLSSILFPKVTKAEWEAKAKARAEAQAREDAQSIAPRRRGPESVRKVVIFGIHGWFPTKLVRTVIGEPTGTSKKFCEEMDQALKDYLKANKVDIPDENITQIPLEGEGKVLDRVELLYKNLVMNDQWRQALEEADLVLVATHSQGTPTSILLLSRLIEEGLVRVQENDPAMQQVGMLTMAGISHGPFPFLKGNLIVRWFEAEAAGELFEFMDSETEIARRYWQAIRTVLKAGVRLTCVASLEDQVVPMYSAVMTSISHPSIVRAVYIDGVSYQDDFLTNLISFALRLRNAGMDDHGVLVHLSEVVAGSIYGEGHSTIYDERDVYTLALRALFEPPSRLTPEKARCEPVMIPFKARQRLNPFYLPWGMRGIMEEITRLGDEVLSKELERLQQLYEEWAPATKGLKEIKFRLEPVHSKL